MTQFSPVTRPVFYNLDGTTPVPCDMDTWGKRFTDDSHSVMQTQIADAHVSTVFLGIDHSFGTGLPVLFETMVFGGPLDSLQYRYRTYNEALEGHCLTVSQVIQEALVPMQVTRILQQGPPLP